MMSEETVALAHIDSWDPPDSDSTQLHLHVINESNKWHESKNICSPHGAGSGEEGASWKRAKSFLQKMEIKKDTVTGERSERGEAQAEQWDVGTKTDQGRKMERTVQDQTLRH